MEKENSGTNTQGLIGIIRSSLKNKQSYYHHLLMLFSGTLCAQIIMLLSAPILSRIFTPLDYGYYAIVVSIITIFQIFATAKFEVAILLPKNEKESLNLAKAAVLISLFVSMSVVLILIFLFSKVVNLFAIPKNSLWLFFIPVNLFIASITLTFHQVLNRKKNYAGISVNRIASATVIALACVGLGLAGWQVWGLLTGQFLGLLTGCLIMIIPLLRKMKVEGFFSIKDSSWRNSAAKYKKYSFHSVSSAVFNTLAIQMPILLMGPFYGANMAGLFFFAYRLTTIPVSLLSGSLTDIYYKYTMENIEKPAIIRKSMEKAVASLFVLALPPSLILLFFGPAIFSTVFSANWEMAGKYAQILTPMFFFKLLSSPLTLFYQKNKTQLLVKWQFVYFSSVICSLFAGKCFHSAMMTVFCISISGSACYIWLMLINFRLTDSSFKSVARNIIGVIKIA